MKSVRQLMGGACALSRIKPPGPSFADYRRWIDECIEAGVVVVEADKQGRPARYSGVFAQAIAKRIAWLQDALQRGIPYAEAEAAFDAAIDRARAKEHTPEPPRQKRARPRPADGYQREADDRGEVEALFARDGGSDG
jgi:hypothetical protein